MQELKLINGQFMRGSEVVPPTIGDPEQIAILRKIEAENERMEKEGIPCEFYARGVCFDGHAKFKCLCGSPVDKFISMREPWTYDLESDIRNQWNKEGVVCDWCDREYVILDGKAKLKITEK